MAAWFLDSDYDGMCRPFGFQVFVFIDGVFAGTVSPLIMNSRTNGAMSRLALVGRDQVIVDFSRYADDDPLCCPSRVSTVTYRIDRARGVPQLLVGEVVTFSTR